MLVTLALFVLLSGVWSKGYPIGTDAWGHIAKAEYLADQIREEGPGAYFSTSWMPNWYMGDAFRTFYPPLTTLILTPIAYLFRDPGQIHKLFASLAVLVFAALCYVSFFRMSSPWPAALGTILALWAPYQLRTLFFEGNYPRILALLALPPIALFSQRLLDRSRPKMPTVIVLSLCWAWAILAHPQQALIFAIGFVFYIVVRLFIDADIPLNWGAWWTAGVVAGALLTALWILPAYSRGEIPQVPYLPQEKVALFSTSIESILPAADITGGQILFGFGTIIMALLAATARPDKNRSAWVFAGIISIWLSFGPRGVLFNLLPLSSQLLPERFLNFATFALAIGASGLLPIGNRARWARVIVVVGAVFIDLFPGWGLIGNHPYPYQQALLSDIDCPDGSSDCRIALLTYPEPDSLEVYFAGQDGRLINGWALENTPHHRALRRVLSATEWSPEYLQHILSLWNVGVAVVGGDWQAATFAQSALAQIGFELRQTRGIYEIWVNPQPAGMLQRIPEQRMLLLGDRLPPFLMTYPFAEEAREVIGVERHGGSLWPHPGLAGCERAAALFSGYDTHTLDRRTRRVAGITTTGRRGSAGVVRCNLSGTRFRLWRGKIWRRVVPYPGLQGRRRWPRLVYRFESPLLCTTSR
ncbi:MAG: 6-pyruvoyl-tetrahydropterin synthase-related protein [Anaerolineales bacterium]